MAGIDATFFDPNNKEGKEAREKMALACLDELLNFIQRPEGGCAVGILDATNTTVARRKKLVDRITQEAEKDPNIKLLFVESMADDRDLLEQNYRMKLENEDYKGTDPEKALADMLERVKKYEEVYESITDEGDGTDISYIKLVNAGKKLISQNVDGFCMRKVQRLLGSVHLKPRTIWIALVGEKENDLKHVLGGDSPLTEAGLEYSRALCDIINERHRLTEETVPDRMLSVFAGTMKRYRQMAEILRSGEAPCQVHLAAYANDLCEGDLDSLTFEEREKKYPNETAARVADKLRYRYPGVGGESYQDLIARCNDLVCYLEQSRGNSVVVCDRAVFRVIKGYFMGYAMEEIPNLPVRPGVQELHRTEKGFGAMHFPVKVGRATSSAGRYDVKGTILAE